MKNIFFTIAFLFLLTSLHGQSETDYYIAPVEIPMLLSGNVGEIRSNHFHSGIDIKTQGVVGKNILAAADGYVSRISVSPTGYGKALYINHPNGTTTVYAHLDRFNDKIGDYVRDAQYRRKSFAVELYPKSGDIAVTQGEIIAFSGNSGSSGGPHLHYEIRDQATQDPLNVLSAGFLKGIKDDIAPQFFHVWVIHVDTVQGVPVHRVQGKYPVVQSEGRYTVEGEGPIPFATPGYFAVEVIDTKNGASNTMGLSRLSQSIDGDQNFGIEIDRFSFATTRHINSMVHYKLHKSARYEVYRSYVAPNNELPVYQGVKNRGIIRLTDTLPHSVEVLIEDDSQNRSLLSFRIQENAPKSSDLPEGIPVYCDKVNTYDSSTLGLNIPYGVLYEDDLLLVDIKEESLGGAYSSVCKVEMLSGIPLQRALTIRIRPDGLPPRLQPKACLASRGSRGQPVYEGGTWERGYVTGTTRTYGDYYVAVDSIPPRLEPNFQRGSDLTNQRGLSLIMRDNFSGIASWTVEIDGEWVLFDYDAKTHTLRHWFRDARYERGKRHKLKATATDKKGNTRTIETEFFR